MRSWGWGLCDGISALIRRGGLSLPLSTMRGHSKKAAVWKLGGEFSPEPDGGGAVRGSTLTETHLPWPGTIVTICVSYFTTGGPRKEHRANKPPLTGRVQEKSKGDSMCPTTSHNPSRWHPSWLSNPCTTRKDSESEWLVEYNPETNPITIKPKTVSHVAEQSFRVPLPYWAPPGHHFPIKSLALSANVSPWRINFWVLAHFWALEGGPPSCSSTTTSDFQPPKLWPKKKKNLLAKSPSLWYFVMAAQID